MKIGFHLQPGTVWRIVSLGANPKVNKRLAQMGIMHGAEVTLVRIGPLGDPVEVAVGIGHHLVLRKEEIDYLECELLAIPLNAASPGSTPYRVRELQGGLGFKRKMVERGLNVGANLRVEEGYPCRVYLLPDGPAAILGRGEAGKLLLEPLEMRERHV